MLLKYGTILQSYFFVASTIITTCSSCARASADSHVQVLNTRSPEAAAGDHIKSQALKGNRTWPGGPGLAVSDLGAHPAVSSSSVGRLLHRRDLPLQSRLQRRMQEGARPTSAPNAEGQGDHETQRLIQRVESRQGRLRRLGDRVREMASAHPQQTEAYRSRLRALRWMIESDVRNLRRAHRRMLRRRSQELLQSLQTPPYGWKLRALEEYARDLSRIQRLLNERRQVSQRAQIIHSASDRTMFVQQRHALERDMTHVGKIRQVVERLEATNAGGRAPERPLRRRSLPAPPPRLQRRGLLYSFPWRPNPDVMEAYPPLEPTPAQRQRAHARNQKELQRLTDQWRAMVQYHGHRWRDEYHLDLAHKDPHPDRRVAHRILYHLDKAKATRSALRRKIDATVGRMKQLGPTTVGDQKHLDFQPLRFKLPEPNAGRFRLPQFIPPRPQRVRFDLERRGVDDGVPDGASRVTAEVPSAIGGLSSSEPQPEEPRMVSFVAFPFVAA